MRGRSIACAGLAAALALPGCATSPASFAARLTAQGRLLQDGPAARMTEAGVLAARADEVPLLYFFAVEAGEAVPFPAGDPVEQQRALAQVRDWGRVARVGEGYVDTQCQAFVSALYDLERSKRATLSGLNALQSATVGIMALAQSAQRAIGVVGVGFGLVSSLFDVSVSRVLYDLPAPSVASVVQAQRAVLRGQEPAVLAGIDSQGEARGRLGEYVQYCAPVTIEANIGKILANARDVGGGQIGAGATPAAITTAVPGPLPAAPVEGARPSQTDPTLALRAFINAAELTAAEAQARRRALRAAAAAEGFPDIVIAAFVRDDSPAGQAAAERVARRLKLIP